MKFPVLVTGVETREGIKDGKPWKMRTVTAVDMSKAGKCSTPIEFTLAKEDEDLAEKLDGQTMEIEIRKIGVYKSRLDVQARISRPAAAPSTARAS